jgi:parallel beta-helix repeat protein
VPLFLLAAFSLYAGEPIYGDTVPVFNDKENLVTGCGTFIKEPGEYQLTKDLYCRDFGVAITVSDVTLDLMGHTISCAYNGIRNGGVIVGSMIFGGMDYVRNVEVTNGAVTGCADGILLAGVVESKVTKIAAWGNRLWYGPDGPTSGTGITVWYSEDNVIRDNHVYDNEDTGILSWIASGNRYENNTTTGNWIGIRTAHGDNDDILCNRVKENGLGIVIGPYNGGSLLRGNLVSHSAYDGISLIGLIYPEDKPLISAVNTIRKNIVEHNNSAVAGASDLFEGYWDFSSNDMGGYVLNEDGCVNTWRENQYETALAPPECIMPPVELDEDDVCALNYDDDDDD